MDNPSCSTTYDNPSSFSILPHLNPNALAPRGIIRIFSFAISFFLKFQEQSDASQNIFHSDTATTPAKPAEPFLAAPQLTSHKVSTPSLVLPDTLGYCAHPSNYAPPESADSPP